VKRRDDGVYFVDFGRDAFAQLELRIPEPANNDAGRKIVIRLGEKLAVSDHLHRTPGGSVRFLETSVTMEKGKSAYRVEMTGRDQRCIPREIGAVMPFRFVELENMPEGTSAQSLTANGIRQIAVHYPFNDAACDFVCSDEKLNAIWALCKHTIKATSFAGVFVDGDRERKPYEADAYINQLGWYYCTDDWTLPRYTHEYLITHPTWPTEWIMFSVLIAWNDYLYTGNTTSLRVCYDDLKAKTLRGLEREDGLISSVEPAVPASVIESVHLQGRLKDIVDWPASERDGCEMLPVNTVVNAFHCRSLALMADIAEALGKGNDAADFRQAAQRALMTFNTKLVDSNSGLYVDGQGSKHSSLHANMFPLAFGLVPGERREKVAAFVQNRGMACSVYGAQFLIDALFDSGRGAYAAQLMEAPGDRSWRHMIEDVGTTMTLEAWDTRYKPNQDWNHAWGAAPANLLPAKVLGVEPLEGGYRKVLVWPRSTAAADLATLSWARGKVPTVKGPILVDWRHTATRFDLSMELPAGVTAEVRLPPNWGHHVQVDGNSRTGAQRDGTVIVEVKEAGKHQLNVGR
jgi:alpha-L-rhamnosidase